MVVIVSQPKRQHYIPKMLLKRFVDPDGWLYCHRGDMELLSVWKSRPDNVFFERHIYTQVRDGEKRGFSVENDFSILEGLASELIDMIIKRVEEGEALRISQDEKKL